MKGAPASPPGNGSLAASGSGGPRHRHRKRSSDESRVSCWQTIFFHALCDLRGSCKLG